MKVAFRLVVLLAVVSSLTLTAGLAHAVPVISSNKENSPEVEGYHRIDAICYHVKSTSGVHHALSKTQYGKPIIVSDDGARASTSNVHQWTGIVKNAGQHYEHLSDALVECWGGGWNGCAQRGKAINGINDFPSEARTNLARLGSLATPLAPYGTLTRVGGQFRWNNQPVTLMGYSWYGAMIGKNCNIPGYLGVLQHYGVNMTRVWVIDNYTAYAEGTNFNNGVIPFTGSFGSYNLNQLNDAFFTRMKQFVDEAWARGIVVQLVLFDRCCLQCGHSMRFNHSPYNTNNNVNDFLPHCTSGYPHFTGMDGTQIGAVNRALIERCVQELAGRGNVLWEIMNEPGGVFPNEVAWHKWVADIIHESYDTEPPSVPTDVEATATSASSIEVTWTASTDNIGVTGYRIFRDESHVGDTIPSTAGWTLQHASAVNDHGQIVGWARNPQGAIEAFLLTPTGTDSLYEHTPLGFLAGHSSSRARGINNLGHVVGTSTSSGGQQRAFLWIDGVMQDLGTLGGSGSSGYDINDSGQIVGWAQQSDGAWRAFRYDNGTMVALDHVAVESLTEPGTYWNTNRGGAYCINNSGQVAGVAYWDSYSGDWVYAARWSATDTSGECLGTREAWGINNLGDVTGWYAAVTGSGSAASAKTACFWDSDGVRTSLGTLGGTQSWAYAINDSRQVVGISTTETPGLIHAFLWDDGTMHNLGGLSGHNWAWATGINENGVVVGSSRPDGNSPGRAFLWEEGVGMVDLNHLVDQQCYYLDTGLAANTTYSYTVSAYDAVGNESAQSYPPAVATTLLDTEAPSVPQDVSASGASGSRMLITWTASTDNVGVEGYKVFRNGVQAGTSSTTSYVDTGLQPSTTYSYTVSAYDASGNESAQSSPPAVGTTLSLPDYGLTPLGFLTGFEEASRARGINDLGQVVGTSTAAGGSYRAFLWDNGVVQNLSTLGGTNSAAYGINDSGQIAGWAQDGETWRAYRYDNGTMVALDHFQVNGWSINAGGAHAINNSGDVAGVAYWRDSGAGGDWVYAARWSATDTSGECLGTREAWGINNHGDVTGWYAAVTGSGSAASAKTACFWDSDGVRTSLGTLGGTQSWAYAINDSRQVVGISTTETPGLIHAFLWDDGTMHNLGGLSGDDNWIWATGINENGVVVGSSRPNQETPGRAFLWKDGMGMVDLNNLLDDSYAGWTLEHAYAINNNGQLVGWGINPQGKTEAFLLTPLIPDEAPALLEAYSVMTHGAAGDFAVEIELEESYAIEPRAGAEHRLEFVFDQEIDITGASVTLSSGTLADLGLASTTVTDDTLVATLAEPPDNNACLHITISGVKDATGICEMAPVTLYLAMIQGEVDGSPPVNLTDLSIVRAELYQPVTDDTFMSDVNADGVINLTDLSLVRDNLYQQAVCP